MIPTKEYIKGYLQGIAQLNMADHCSLDYDLDEIPAIGTLVESVCAYMQLTPQQASLDRLQDWEQPLMEILPGWLFYRLREVENDFRTTIGFNEEQVSRHFIHLLKEWLSYQGSKLTVFKVKSTPDSFYELEWDDYLFFTNGKLYFLHFGRSD